MSIYSGFATRNLETAYNNGVCNLIQLIQTNLLYLLKGEPIDTVLLAASFTKTFRELKRLEKRKHLQPNFTSYCNDIALYFGTMDKPLSQGGSSVSSITRKEFDAQVFNDSFSFEERKHRFTPVHIASELEPVTEKRSLKRRVMSKDTLNRKESEPRLSGSPLGRDIYPLSLKTPQPYKSQKFKSFKPEKASQIYQQRAFLKLNKELESFT
ncbi:unnamed protein product [Blepharisma stoltei]|uniref:Uncharacterized protein n=1 Tax=Blepharisma stoltei TaxID=1481888 RepID=A0AAU9IM94_9CILI|nr:unnamed protein product [Blepharisma stoltei]